MHNLHQQAKQSCRSFQRMFRVQYEVSCNDTICGILWITTERPTQFLEGQSPAEFRYNPN